MARKKTETDSENRKPNISGRVWGPLNWDKAGIQEFFGDINRDREDTHRLSLAR